MVATDVFDGPALAYRDPRFERTSSGDKRRDIQGLRMVAVLAVVANHLTNHPRGGFVGVDIFFVISGYLITGLLVRDLGGASGPAQFITNFYRRRVRRLLPAALLVIAATIVAAHTQFDTARFETTLHDGGWATVFWENWHLIHVGTNYFTAGLPPSPFQHYWSLSVEEQFYFVWPIALFVLAIGVRHRSLQARRAAVFVAAAALSAASLVFAFTQSTANPTGAYFSTFTRGWELGAGAMLACAVPYLRARSAVLSAMSWAGLVMIVVSLFLARGGAGFPAPGALLPCAGAILVIAATSRDGQRARNVVLTNRAANFVGDISYSVYLVHFPVIILLATATPQKGTSYYLVALSLTFALSIALYSFVERPVLNSSWLRPRGGERAAAADTVRTPRLALGIGALACIAGLAALAQPDANVAAAQKYAQFNEASSVTGAQPKLPPKAAALSRRISEALAAKSWPKLHPSIASELSGANDLPLAGACGGITLLPATECTAGPKTAAKSMYVVGDSTSMVYDEALDQIVTHRKDWKVRFAGAYGCQFSSVVYEVPEASIQDKCARHNDVVVQDIKKLKPTMLVVVNNHAAETAVGGQVLTATQHASDVGAELAKVRSSVKRIVFLEPPPGGGDPATCYTPSSHPIDCVSTIPDAWLQWTAADATLSSSLRSTVIDSRTWFCNVDLACPEFVGTVPVMRDSVHGTRAYMDVIWPVMDEALTRAHLLR